jgi:hypothetical protein
MLIGEAKKRYQKEYMRRRRAEQHADEVEYCLFCDKPKDEVTVLVSAPEPYAGRICDVCAAAADGTAREWKRFPATRS